MGSTGGYYSDKDGRYMNCSALKLNTHPAVNKLKFSITHSLY